MEEIIFKKGGKNLNKNFCLIELNISNNIFIYKFKVCKL